MNRFVKEYANYKIKQVKNDWLTEENKAESVKLIESVLFDMYGGFITVDEAMRMISEV